MIVLILCIFSKTTVGHLPTIASAIVCIYYTFLAMSHFQFPYIFTPLCVSFVAVCLTSTYKLTSGWNFIMKYVKPVISFY